MAIDKKELIEALKSLSREEWKEILSAQETVLQPTNAEKDEEITVFKSNIISKLKDLLHSRYDIDIAIDITEQDLLNVLIRFIDEHEEMLKKWLGDSDSIEAKKEFIEELINNSQDSYIETILQFYKFLNEYPV